MKAKLVLRLINLRRNLLRKFYSAYPGGWPGLGLLLLRGLAGFTFIASSLEYARSTNLSFVTGMLVAVRVVSATCLLIGFMTPIAAVLAGLAGVCPALLKISFLISTLSETNGITIEATVVVFAIALIGPGAFSLDAKMFGRREIRIPAAPHPSAPD